MKYSSARMFSLGTSGLLEGRLGTRGVLCALVLSVASFVCVTKLGYAEAVTSNAALANPASVATYPSSLTYASLRMIGGLLMCLGVFALVVRYIKRHSGQRLHGTRRMQVRERLSLSPKVSLTLIAIDSKEFLVAAGNESISIIPTQTARSEMFAASLDEADAQEVFNA
jgi:flagellar biogenesis protein FliO